MFTKSDSHHNNRDAHNKPVEKPPLLSPASLGLLTCMAGPHISLLPGMHVFSRLGLMIKGGILLFLAALLYLGLYGFLLLWPTQWYWASLVLLVAHLGCAICYYLVFRKLHQSNPKEYTYEFPTTTRKGSRFIFTGIAGGAFFIPLLGMIFFLLFLLGIDRLLFTVMPVAFDDNMSLVLLILGMFGLFFTGAIGGGWVGKLKLKLTPLQLVGYSVGLIWIVLLWFFFLQLFIILPGFLTSQIGNYQLFQPFLFFILGFFFIGSWWSAYLFLYALRPSSIAGQVLRFAQAPLASCSAAFIFALICGYPANWFYSTGMYFEKEGNVASSLWCYEKGMSKQPSGLRASHLQYRIALMAHKLGDNKKAVNGFRRVVSMYNQNENLVTKSTKFLNNLERNAKKGRRVVLPGVENPTAFKGAYCVPNSLALVLNFWGAAIEANTIGQAITSLNSGTMVVDQAWYAEQMGFKHEFLPLATFDDIKVTIDAGFPVLVYVPAHVFVIVGYDEVLETFVTYDVATKDIWIDYLQKDFIKSWKKEDTTMVIVYPPDQHNRLPQTIREAVAQTSSSYLHYHLHYLDSPDGYPSIDHLLEASQTSDEFFLPLITAYENFPSRRPLLLESHKIDDTVNSIINYFRYDYDEGTHLAGQMHYNDYVSSDDKLKSSLAFLVGTQQFEKASSLIEAIDLQGEISSDTLKIQAMLDLAVGNFADAIPRLTEIDEDEYQFYLAQSYLKEGNLTSAIPGLVETTDNCT